MPTPHLISPAELARRGRVSPMAAWKWTQAEDFPRPVVTLRGNRRLYDFEEVIEWLARHLPKRAEIAS